MDGIIVIHKAAGMTSHDVVGRVRRILQTRKVGHSGTLDPAVTGVLPVCLGKGTRMVEYLQDLPKEYVAEMTIGFSTDTEDQTGNPIDRKEVIGLTEEAIRNAMAKQVGEIEQIPPMFSAVKVNGKRLYELAREGKEIERKARTVTIYELEVLSIHLGPPYPTVRFCVRCSKGTYIRTLCVDIGRALGYPSHMSHLVRTASGPFSLSQSVSLEHLEEAVREGKLEPFILPIDLAVAHLPKAVLMDEKREDVLNGKTLSIQRFTLVSRHPDFSTFDSEKITGQVAVYDQDQNFLAIYRADPASLWLKPVKVFN